MKKQRIKLIAIDLDNTLLRPDLTISERTIDLIKRLQNDGYIVVIATGRIYSSALAISKNAGLDMPLIGCNGAVVYDKLNDCFYKKTFPLGLAEKVVDILQEADIYHHFYTNDTIYASEMVHTAKRFNDIKEDNIHGAKLAHVKEIKIIKDLKPVLAGNDIYKFGIVEDGTYDFAKVRAIFDRDTAFDTVFSNVGLCDISMAGVSKWTAIEKLLKVYGFAANEVLAFGDSPNDIEMLQNAGIGVAMANACAEVKAIADEETLSNADDGVYHYLKEFMTKY